MRLCTQLFLFCFMRDKQGGVFKVMKIDHVLVFLDI